MDSGYHTPVLVEEVIRLLNVNPDGIYVDGTLGGGGHAESILMRLSLRGRLIGFDIDSEAIKFSENRLSKFGDRVIYFNRNFVAIKKSLNDIEINYVDGILLDLGLSSHQIDTISRGFSFRQNGRIDMRMDQTQLLDGWKVINTYDQNRLSDIFRNYGEDRNSKRIARKIVQARSIQTINTTHELAEIIEPLVGERFLIKSLARIWQAIRIEVNGEMNNLRSFLKGAAELLSIGGRIVVISYHSLEDRIVKEFIRQESKSTIASFERFLPEKELNLKLKNLTKKPLIPNDAEMKFNSRARSAKLRAAERI